MKRILVLKLNPDMCYLNMENEINQYSEDGYVMFKKSNWDLDNIILIFLILYSWKWKI